MTRLQRLLDQIAFARRYTTRLLDHTPVSDWFHMPSGVTHIAWQVGHLAMAEYRLGLDRVRGARAEDTEFFPEEMQHLFGRDSVPGTDTTIYPSAEKIRGLFDQVHEQLLRELPLIEDATLDEPVLKPHALVKTREQSLIWCAQHEAIHAGQIGLLRRELGLPPIW